jgi:hypothetical protein
MLKPSAGHRLRCKQHTGRFSLWTNAGKAKDMQLANGRDVKFNVPKSVPVRFERARYHSSQFGVRFTTKRFCAYVAL